MAVPSPLSDLANASLTLTDFPVNRIGNLDRSASQLAQIFNWDCCYAGGS